MIPETSELLGVISSDKEAKELREDIDKARTKATMIAEEKIQTAEQAYSLVRDQTDRLDRIIMDFEAYLHQENLFDDPDGDDEGMSGGGVQQLQQQWQQQQYQPQQQQQQQQQYQQQQQQWDQPPVPSNGIFSSYSAETQYSNSISNNNSNRNSNSNNNNSINNNNNNSSNNNNNNSSNNNNAPPSSPPPNQLNKFGFRRPVETETVAINVEESEWIVAKVISSDLLNETLKLQDADVEASHKQYTLPEERVRTLFFSHFNSVNNASTLKLSRGEVSEIATDGIIPTTLLTHSFSFAPSSLGADHHGGLPGHDKLLRGDGRQAGENRLKERRGRGGGGQL